MTGRKGPESLKRFTRSLATPREQVFRGPWTRQKSGDNAPSVPPEIRDQISGAFSRKTGMDPERVPVIVNSFNQLTYLRTMVDQLTALGCQNLMVLDQASTYPPLLEYLSDLERAFPVVRLKTNHGPHWLFTSGLSMTLPDFFIYTDPDIRFRAEMPRSFVADLLRAADALDATKVGLALDVSRPEAMKQAIITIGGTEYTLPGWEEQFWRDPVLLDDLQLYRAPVDTTFALYNRRAFDPYARIYRRDKVFDCMDTPRSYRLAGRYTAVHTPWMLDDPIPIEELDYYVAHRSRLHDY